MKYWLIAIAVEDDKMQNVQDELDALWEEDNETLAVGIQGVTVYGTFDERPQIDTTTL
jgi:hypothetical protein